MKEKNHGSYRELIKSSSLMGGVSVLTMFSTMLKMKFAALYVGAYGMGILANYTAICAVMTTLFGLGLQSSAIREIALAVSASDHVLLGRIVKSLKRVTFLTSVFGGLFLVLGSSVISNYSFGENSQSVQIKMLSIVLILSNLAGGYMAIIQGLSRVKWLAITSMINSLVASISSLFFYYNYGLDGIIPSLIFPAVISLLVSQVLLSMCGIHKSKMTWKDSIHEVRGMLKLGITFMWTAAVVSFSGLMINNIVSMQKGIQSLGLYSAAYSLSAASVNFILSAMGTGFYPRLTEASRDKTAMNLLVNKQTEIGLLLSLPIIIGAISFTPWLLKLFYTESFQSAAILMRWFILGCLVRVIQWPMGYLQLALAEGAIYSFTQTAFNVIHVLFAWFLVMHMGIEGVALAFFIAYLASLVTIKMLAWHLTGFRWTRKSLQMISIGIVSVLSIFFGEHYLSIANFHFIGLIATFSVSLICLRGLIVRSKYDGFSV